MVLGHPLQLAVEVPACGVRVVLVAGELDRASSSRLAELVDVQARHLAAAAEGGRVGHVVIELGNVRFFSVGGLETLLGARETCRRAGVGLHLTGLAGREALLPRRVVELLGAEIGVFATLEQALAELRAPDAAG